MTIFLVEFIFCTVFKTSKLIQLFITFFNNVSNIDVGWGSNPLEWIVSLFGKILFFVVKFILKIFSAFAGILQELCKIGGGHIGGPSLGGGGASAGGGGIGGIGGIGGGGGGGGAGGGATGGSSPFTLSSNRCCSSRSVDVFEKERLDTMVVLENMTMFNVLLKRAE